MTARAEMLAALVAALLGAPLVFLFASAAFDGQRRATEAPLRSLFGSETYDKLAAGEALPVHYFGNDRTAPKFTLRDRTGAPWSLEAHRGKVILLNFWSITCQPCVEEMPSLLELGRIVKGQEGIEVVAVSVDANWDAVKTLFPSDPPLTVLFDPDRAVVKDKFGTRLYPETWIIDPEGVIRVRYDGPHDWSSALVVDLLKSLR
jgi:peroxiredoxin